MRNILVLFLMVTSICFAKTEVFEVRGDSDNLGLRIEIMYLETKGYEILSVTPLYKDVGSYGNQTFSGYSIVAKNKEEWSVQDKMKLKKEIKEILEGRPIGRKYFERLLKKTNLI